MRLFLFVCVAVSSFAFADTGLPKSGSVLTDAGRPPVAVSISDLNLSLIAGTCTSQDAGGALAISNMNQAVTVTIGSESYTLANPNGHSIGFKKFDPNCRLVVDNIEFIQLDLVHTTLKTVRGVLFVNPDKKLIRYSGASGGVGEITDWY
jgi:hypothetical protein